MEKFSEAKYQLILTKRRKIMKLIVKCEKCRQENKAPHHVNNRIDYAKEYGDSFSLTCNSCNETSECHVDDIRAEDYSFGEIIKNRVTIFVIISLLTLIVGFFLGGFYGAIILPAITILLSIGLIKNNNSSKNLTFNKHKMRGRVSNVGFIK